MGSLWSKWVEHRNTLPSWKMHRSDLIVSGALAFIVGVMLEQYVARIMVIWLPFALAFWLHQYCQLWGNAPLDGKQVRQFVFILFVAGCFSLPVLWHVARY